MEDSDDDAIEHDDVALQLLPRPLSAPLGDGRSRGGFTQNATASDRRGADGYFPKEKQDDHRHVQNHRGADGPMQAKRWHWRRRDGTIRYSASHKPRGVGGLLAKGAMEKEQKRGMEWRDAGTKPQRRKGRAFPPRLALALPVIPGQDAQGVAKKGEKEELGADDGSQHESVGQGGVSIPLRQEIMGAVESVSAQSSVGVLLHGILTAVLEEDII